MKPLRVYFPWYQIESHREPWQSARIVTELADLGVQCLLEMGPSVDVVFCGGLYPVEDAANGYWKDPNHRRVVGYREFPSVPVVLYNWDLYPWLLEDRSHPEYERWRAYLIELERCAEVWVPSEPVARRTHQYLNRPSRVIRGPVCSWEPDAAPMNGGYVVDVMRKYKGDPNNGLVESVCHELGIPCVETGASLGWDHYRHTIANAGLLVSAYREASTGSLALLEGYRLGKPVLLSNSEWHGGRDHFGDRARYFQWDDPKSLRYNIADWYANRDALEYWEDPAECREWVEENYSEKAFARRMSEALRKVVAKC